MTTAILGPDPLEILIDAALRRLSEGEAPSAMEVERVDVKEEPGRRAADGSILSGAETNEQAADYLAGEMACMANTPGGGAVIVGVADGGQKIGTELNPEWLRHRIWELTAGSLTISARVANVEGSRLLVLSSVEALSPVVYRGRVRWRVGTNCVDVDPVTWQSRTLLRRGYDWSDQPSGHTLADVSPVACEIARTYLRSGQRPGRTSDSNLADVDDTELLRRLNLVTDGERLTNAGSMMFVATPWPGIDYIRRNAPGDDSSLRIEAYGPLLAQVREVEQAASHANPTTHLARGFAHAQVRAIAPRALREAIINGITHRDWMIHLPTTVEHVGDTLIVTSPGGFVGGVAPENIITHVAVPRYKSLALAMARLGLAEREGVGVDRMVSDMLRAGRPAPVFSEDEGPFVRVALLGGPPDQTIIDLLGDLTPPQAATVEVLLLINHLTRHGWVDAQTAAPVLQRSPEEAEQAIAQLADTTLIARDSDQASPETPAIIVRVAGVPSAHSAAHRLSDAARQRLADRTKHLTTPEGRLGLIIDWSRARGRVSSTEAADLTGLSRTSTAQLLASLADEGQLNLGRPNRTGRGFFYTPDFYTPDD
ncbi:MAG: hypothetical protein OXB92_11060 [Acidimicrobiaceae bacterium]|nr:hypothetical protein [Acidimicrobiia bacterium]MCY4494383.1 hypothetical protein [Acidimicrobiaceae bacterium]